MREIKFRAWDKTRKSMEEVLELTFHFGSPPLEYVYVYDEADQDAKRLLLRGEVDLMQYTGLKDKNGVEIYEGDILKWSRPAKGKKPAAEFVAGEMIFLPNAEGWWVKSLDDKNWEQSDKPNFNSWRPGGLNPSYGMAEKYLEVIGNIYENPELVK